MQQRGVVPVLVDPGPDTLLDHAEVDDHTHLIQLGGGPDLRDVAVAVQRCALAVADDSVGRVPLEPSDAQRAHRQADPPRALTDISEWSASVALSILWRI